MRYMMLSAAAATILLLQGCSFDDETPEQPVRQSNPIRFSSVAVGSDYMVTRALVGADAHNEGLAERSDINVFIYDKNGAPVLQDVETSVVPQVVLPLVYETTSAADPETAKSSLSLKDPRLALPKYPTDGTAYIFAFYPALTAADASFNYAFSVATDQRNVASVEASDLLATDRIVQKTKSDTPSEGSGGEENDQNMEKSIDLNLRHCMAQIIVRFNPTGSLTDSNMPKEFTVSNVSYSVGFNAKTAATSEANGGHESISTSSSSANIQATAEQAFLLPPQTIAANQPFIKFDISGNETDKFKGVVGASYAPSTDLVLMENTIYEITVNVNVSYISATATITPWTKESMSLGKHIL